MATSKANQSYIMNTTALEISIAENIPLGDLITRPSVRNDGTWVVLQKSTKRVVFRKRFN